MDSEQFQRYMRWRFRHMSIPRSCWYMARMALAFLLGRFFQFIQNDARSIDKCSAISYDRVQRRVTR